MGDICKVYIVLSSKLKEARSFANSHHGYNIDQHTHHDPKEPCKVIFVLARYMNVHTK